MPTEEEKRLHRCCFSGHRPEKLNVSEADVKNWLNEQIDEAIADGYKTFITGCAMGVDIWAGQIVLQKKEQNPDLHLIAATPWPGFASRWSNDWQRQYNDLIHKADWVVNVSNHYDDGVFTKRNNWMCDHSNRVIAFYNGAPGGTRNMLAYAETKQIEIVTNNPEYTLVEKQKRERKESKAEKVSFPENLITDIGLELVFENAQYVPLTEDQLAGLKYAITTIRDREQEMLSLRYEKQQTLQEIGEHYELSRERVRQILVKAVRKLRHPSRVKYYRDGLKATEALATESNYKTVKETDTED